MLRIFFKGGSDYAVLGHDDKLFTFTRAEDEAMPYADVPAASAAILVEKYPDLLIGNAPVDDAPVAPRARRKKAED